MNSIRLSNGVEIQLLQSQGHFQGLGHVKVAGFDLRSPRRPMFVDIRTPEGIQLQDYTLDNTEQTPDHVTLTFKANRTQGGLMEWMVHEVRSRVNTADWTQAPTPAEGTVLKLKLKPLTRQIGEHAFHGFSYQYTFSSPDIAIYKILDRATWEPSGHAVGSEFWMRNCFTPSTVHIQSKEQFHSTEWYLPGCANPNIFQFLPLQTELQGFSFTATDQGVLVTWTPEIAHVRSLFEKQRGSDEWVHFHELCADLSKQFQAPAMEVLWTAGAFDRVDRMNVYESVRALVSKTLHANAGLVEEVNQTYGQIEEWGTADVARYTELGVPKLVDAGIEVIGIANHFATNMNTFGVTNMCCTVDHRIAASVGADKVKALCDKAKAWGATVEMWGNTALSTLAWTVLQTSGDKQRIDFYDNAGTTAEVFSKCKDPFVRNASNAIESDHYAPVFAVMNLRDPGVRAHWIKSWKTAHDQIGIQRIFLDSSFNLSSDKFHWVGYVDSNKGGATADQTHLLGHYRPAEEARKAVLSQYKAHLEITAEMQKFGIRYCNEDLGVFGIHRHGPGADARVQNLFLWNECLVTFDIPALQKIGADPDSIYFRALAYRMAWIICWDIQRDSLSFHYAGTRGDFDVPTPAHLELLRAFKTVRHRMVDRHVLPGERAVVYRHGTHAVVWAFDSLDLSLAHASALRDVLEGSPREIENDRIHVKKHHIYTFELAPDSTSTALSDLVRLAPHKEKKHAHAVAV